LTKSPLKSRGPGSRAVGRRSATRRVAAGTRAFAPSLLLCALLVVPLLCGCSTRFVRGRAERRIQHKLVDLIGPAERYQVRVRGTKDAEIVAGRLRRIDVDGWNVRAANQIDLESFHLELNNLRYHAPPDESLSIGDSHLEIQITEPALNSYLRRQHPDNRPEITLDNGKVTLKGSLRLLGIDTPLVTAGWLEVVDQTRVNFRAESVRLSTEPIPGIGTEYVESHLNPLLNITRLNLPLRLDEIEVRPGRLIVRGSAHLPPTRDSP
jgi:hypothetical protein